MNQQQNTSLGNLAINFRSFFRQCVSRWWWFAVSAVVCTGLAFTYTKIKNPVYLVSSSILVSDDSSVKKSGILSLANSFDLGGMLGGTSSVYNELTVLSSYSVMRNTVSDLRLNEIYVGKKYGIKKVPYSPASTPVEVLCAPQIPDTLQSGIVFNVKVNSSGQASVKMKAGNKTLYNEKHLSLPLTINSKWGDFTLRPTEKFQNGKSLNLNIIYLGYGAAAEMYQESVMASIPNKKSDFLALSLATTTPDYGKKILTEVIENYNRVGIEQQRLTANRTLRFLNSTLDSLVYELDALEHQVEHYKKSLNVADVESAAELAVMRQAKLRDALVAAETEFDVMKLIKNFIVNPDNSTSLIPVLMDGESAASSAISAYNEVVLERMKLENNAKANNTALKLIDEQLSQMRANINTSLDRMMDAASLRLADLRKQVNSANAAIGNMPTAEREFISIKRRQTVEEQLYLYLLKQREETSMSLVNVQPRGAVIDAPYVHSREVGLSPTVILGLAFIFGLVLPGAYLFFKNRIINTSDSPAA